MKVWRGEGVEGNDGVEGSEGASEQMCKMLTAPHQNSAMLLHCTVCDLRLSESQNVLSCVVLPNDGQHYTCLVSWK